MAQIKNDCLLRALLRKPVDKVPVWMMRQAGRYLPEYRKVRKHAGDFLALCRNPTLACEVALHPLERYKLDAAILFSDILTIPDALGLGLYFEAGDGPKFKYPFRSSKDLDRFDNNDVKPSLSYVFDAVTKTNKALDGDIPLIGFSGSPWTLASYMVEGASSRDFKIIKTLMYQEPDLLHALLERLASLVTWYLNEQIKHGVQVVQIFDTWGGVLSYSSFLEFSLVYMQKIVDGLIKNHNDQPVPVILFTKGGGGWLDHLADTGASALGLDWTTNLSDARKMVGDKVAIQGNLDPCVLYSSSNVIRNQVKQTLTSYGRGTGYVFNLGHGLQPDMDVEKVKVCVDAVREYSHVCI